MIKNNANLKLVDKKKTSFSFEGIKQDLKGKLNWKSFIAAWAVISGLIALGLYFEWDAFIVGSITLVITIISQAIGGAALLIGSIPIVGPAIASVLSIPIVWFVNGIGYLASFIAIKRGYSKDVITYRALTISALVGITIGYVLGKYF